MDLRVPSMAPGELKRLFDEGTPLVLLDVREDSERSFCAIAAPETARDLHVPMGQIPHRLGEFRGERPTIVVYCHHGVRSMAVARWLASQGVGDVANLDGGVDAWSILVDRGVRRY